MKKMVWRLLSALVLASVSLSVLLLGNNAAHADSGATRLITVYDRGVNRVFITKAKTLGDALKEQHITLDSHDAVEPAVSTQLVAASYRVNIYRARPVVVVDGTTRVKVLSAHQTAQQIAQDANVSLYGEDDTTLKPLTDFAYDGAGLELVITRAKLITLDLYGKQTQIRTQAKTIGEMLQQKKIILGSKGRVSLPESTPITDGLSVRVWREGVQTITEEQAIPFSSKIVYDTDRPLGYRAVQSNGVNGVQSVTYQVNIQNGAEISRVQIASITTQNPVDQIEDIGIQNNGSGLTKSKGSQYFTDSKGVTHRETYYDLNMSTAMQACGQGGHYSVRPDGAKVDSNGYIIIAADYALYPKCSLVETSLGTGKVYDTGGFVARYPTGFDLATDWTQADGI